MQDALDLTQQNVLTTMTNPCHYGSVNDALTLGHLLNRGVGRHSWSLPVLPKVQQRWTFATPTGDGPRITRIQQALCAEKTHDAGM